MLQFIKRMLCRHDYELRSQYRRFPYRLHLTQTFYSKKYYDEEFWLECVKCGKQRIWDMDEINLDIIINFWYIFNPEAFGFGYLHYQSNRRHQMDIKAKQRKVSCVSNLIADTKGKFFKVVIKKKDGSIRDMTCRTGVAKHIKGTARELEDGVIVWDSAKKEYRTVKYESVKMFKCGQTQLWFN